MKTAIFKTNINCDHCIKSVTPYLNEVDNVETWKVDTNTPDKILEVQLDDEDLNSVVNAVTAAGFEIAEVVD